MNNQMKIGVDYPISALTANEWKGFALYTIENRAIPNMIDGLKNVQRFYLYSSLVNTKKDYKRVSAVAGVISDYGYNHGESSAAGAGQLMAATWSNNVCLVEGRGSFGTRLVPHAAAPRYTYTRLHDNFFKYVKDVDLAPTHSDPEHTPPAFYIPVIPLVLANGVKGIATGFATNILPRDPKDLANACKEYVETGDIKRRLDVVFPMFKGKTVFEGDKYVCYGIFERKGKSILLINEVPYGYDRESYVEILDKMEDKGDIVGYTDLCDQDGFKFEVKLKQTSISWDDNRIIKEFKLSKQFSENITVIDQKGKLKEYDDERQLIKDFCDYRMGILQNRIEKQIDSHNEEIRWLEVKQKFVNGVLDDVLKFKGIEKNTLKSNIKDVTNATDEDVDRLLRMAISTLTYEMVIDLEKEIKQCQKSLKSWKSTTPSKQYIYDLEAL